MSERCPFCGGDPYHYEDVGLSVPVRVAVNCCDLGVAWFSRPGELPDTLIISWEDFERFGRVFEALRVLGMNP